jgi:hypothetical protein
LVEQVTDFLAAVEAYRAKDHDRPGRAPDGQVQPGDRYGLLTNSRSN